ncbi:fimbrillin family protein [Bacteroides sp. OttesenSCG-928-N06]|nr:fimbrillin family protein [Bacteroides sp. OttesenSCG-928-N06]
MGVYATKGGSPYANNVKLTYDGNTWSGELYFAPSGDTDTYTFSAYYPYVPNLADANAIPVNVVDNPADHLVAPAVSAARGTTVYLTFQHALALVQVDFDATQCYISPNLAVTLQGCIPTGSYSLTGTATATGTPAPIPMTRLGTTNTFRAMVPAQTIPTATRMFRIKNDDLFQSQPLANALTLSAGQVEVFTQMGVDYASLITDNKLQQYCLTHFDNNPQDGKLSYTEVMTAKVINVFGQGITTLAWIEHFKNLEELVCSNNQLTGELPISGLTQLTNLSCYDNQLTQLPISGLTQLTHLDCYNNQLTELLISDLTQLTYLICRNNELTQLPISGLTQLTHLNCYNNPINEVDVSAHTALRYLECGNKGAAFTVWVAPTTILGSGAGKLWIRAVHAVGDVTSYYSVTQRDSPSYGVVVKDNQ